MKASRFPVVVLLTALILGCEGRKEPVEPPEAAPVEQVKQPPAPPLDQIKLDVRNRRIEIAGRFCLKEGILDYFAVTSGGQEYESVVAVYCKGSLLHAALLSLDAVAGPTQQVLDELKKNPPKSRKVPERTGTPLDLTVEWELDGKTFSEPAHRLLFNRSEKSVQHSGYWVFTGSYFTEDLEDETKQLYMADVDKALVAVLYTGSAVVNFSHDAGNPYEGQAAGYEVNKELVAPPGTPVRLVITPAKAQETP